MDVKQVKEYIYENNKIEDILIELGMHHIKWHDNNTYVTCGMPDGDNPQSTTVYNNLSLNVVAYTRDIVDEYGVSDIISLVCFIKDLYFSNAIHWLCSILGLDYYYVPPKKDKLLEFFQNMISIKKKSENEEPPLQPLDEINLIQYGRYSFQQFVDDNISDETQIEFELGLDSTVDYWGMPRPRIAIPIRDENGTLVGVKGRILKNVWKGSKCVDKMREEDNEPKYIYMYPCAKSQILYGLYKTQKYIKEKKEVIICEAEKGVMQLWTYGYKNCVSIGGHSLSPYQKEKIIRLGASITIAFDKDVDENTVRKECKELSTLCKSVYYILDRNNILGEKESPMDDPKKWDYLYKNNRYKYV